VIAISYLCTMPSLPSLAKQAEDQGNEMVRKQLHNMNPSALGFVTILALISALYIKVRTKLEIIELRKTKTIYFCNFFLRISNLINCLQ
jgi:hypothetical protein